MLDQTDFIAIDNDLVFKRKPSVTDYSGLAQFRLVEFSVGFGSFTTGHNRPDGDARFDSGFDVVGRDPVVDALIYFVGFDYG